MRVEVEIGGRPRIVEVSRTGDAFLVSVDGRRRVVDVARTGHVWSLLTGPVREREASARPADGARPGHGWAERDSETRRGRVRSYEVAADDRRPGEFAVHVNGRVIAVHVRGWRGARRHASGEARAAGGAEAVQVVAPMPGRVIRVLVEPGDVVAASQGLVVIEAMKMENELRALRAGTVREVRVAPGALVEARTVLVVIA